MKEGESEGGSVSTGQEAGGTVNRDEDSEYVLDRQTKWCTLSCPLFLSRRGKRRRPALGGRRSAARSPVRSLHRVGEPQTNHSSDLERSRPICLAQSTE